MARGRPLRTRHANRYTPLTADQVYDVLAGNIRMRTTRTPLRANEVAEYCRALYAGCEHVSYAAVRDALKRLLNAERIITLTGEPANADRLRELGVANPQPRHRYWSVPRD